MEEDQSSLLEKGKQYPILVPSSRQYSPYPWVGKEQISHPALSGTTITKPPKAQRGEDPMVVLTGRSVKAIPVEGKKQS